ncbi:uncharacterized protein LOC132644349 [Lycium barbarum]|uniref:uncharacterized protein LOC132644349 n=1 Tax=Lycium barbarum TaxID=112863 RepID=UPI00293E9661|nr:uncharacterized protein LOC132644349 [Lycium barbarum]
MVIDGISAPGESRNSGAQADKDIKIICFSRSFRVQAQGFSGGIWVLWRDCLDIEVLSFTFQYVNLKISVLGLSDFIFTAIYASPIACIGGAIRGSHPFSYFQNFINSSSSIDMDFQGPIWTGHMGLIKERLDRHLCSLNWRLMFDYALVVHLPRVLSDHLPLLRLGILLRISMRFSSFAHKVSDWNKNVFGNIFEGKKRILDHRQGAVFTPKSDECMISHNKEVLFDEVHNALFEMKPFKVADVDGFRAVFFQSIPVGRLLKALYDAN